MKDDATAMYLRQQLASTPVRATRLARGLPVGRDMEYGDQLILMRVLDGRQEMGN